MAEESALDLSCEQFYSSLLFDEIQNVEDFSMSDDKYAEQLQDQEVTSTIFNQKSTHSPAVESPVDQPEVVESALSFCEICAERKEKDQMFKIDSCIHIFCTDCISKHISIKIQEKIHVVTCPGVACRGILDFGARSSIIPKDVRNNWDELLCESIILASQKFYCPYKDCSAMLVNDSNEIIRESECPVCRRLFCAQCYVPWHSGVECAEFQSLNVDERSREDLMMKELAKAEQWSRCPDCRYFVEKTKGCIHMTCRCGSQFCYICGITWTANHAC